MCLETFNDPYKPNVIATFECVKRDWEVCNLLGVQEKATIFVHGNGHDTVPNVKNMVYAWFDRFLK